MFTLLTIGDRLRQARKAARIGGQELGEVIGVGKSQISNIENSRSDLTRGNAVILSEKLGVRLNWLLNGEEPMVEPKGRKGSNNSENINTVNPNQNISIGCAGGEASSEVLYLRERIAYLEKKNDELTTRLLNLLEKQT